MRLHSLELTGFGPFRHTQRVDFDAFADDGVFLISGRTGTGKSSILDGVSFALYGSVPRYDGGEKRLRSDHSGANDPSEVRLEFTIDGVRWRVTRAPEYERPAKRGGGVTTEQPRAELEEEVDGAWIARAAKPREVGLALTELLGLNAQQFQQVILLAQNKFSRFLLAAGDERQALLRTLFGTRRFQDYEQALDDRRRAVRDALAAVSERRDTLLGIADGVIAADDGSDEEGQAGAAGDLSLDAQARRGRLVSAEEHALTGVEHAAAAREQAAVVAAAAREELTALTERVRSRRERTATVARVRELDEQANEVSQLREQVTAARQADALRAALDAADRASAAHADAVQGADEALQHWVSGGGDESVDPSAHADVLTAELARWEGAAADERAHATLVSECAALDAALADADRELTELEARRESVPAEKATLAAESAAARVGAERADELHRDVAALAAQIAAAREAEALAATSADAEAAHLRASAAADSAAAAVTLLLQRRIEGMAGELGASLVDGEPCAVCGSTVHPHPAAAGDEGVTEEELASAEAHRETTHATATAAGDAARALRERLSAAHTRAGGRTSEELSSLHDAALAAAERADAAAETLASALRRGEELDARAASLDVQRVDLAAHREQLHAEALAKKSEAARAEAAARAARGTFASVVERIALTEAERERARALSSARAILSEAARALKITNDDLAARLGTSPFASSEEARAAQRDAADLAALEERIQAYDAAREAARTRLAELGEADDAHASDDALALAQQQAAEAELAHNATIGAESAARHRADRLRELRAQVDSAFTQFDEVGTDAEAVTRLADTVAGRAPNTMKMDLETFVLAAELEEIVAAANVRLADMSAGRYTLHHSDARAARGRASGLGIDVRDAHTGRARSPQSLSGGETFLASLALALGLGEVVTSRAGGIRLDTLFVDEGFGSLDPETLDLAMRTLDELRAGGRTVGVISHVEAMKEQLPAQLVVEAAAEGHSVIRHDIAERT